MEKLRTLGGWVTLNWERVLFVIVGLFLMSESLRLIYLEKITEAAAVFGLGFLSFIYANVARFKRFKGLGFEAELWEDKQKEASDLIERLREVISIYTREVILGKVKGGRWAGRTDWAAHWQLYEDLITQHSILGQKIDFSGVKKEMDDYFLFDMTQPEIAKVRQAIMKGKNEAQQKISKEFGSPIQDIEGHNKRLAEFRKIPETNDDPFQFSTQNDLAGHTLGVWEDARSYLKRDFGVDINVDAEVLERLKAISKHYRSRPVVVTSELIDWANRES